MLFNGPGETWNNTEQLYFYSLTLTKINKYCDNAFLIVS